MGIALAQHSLPTGDNKSYIEEIAAQIDSLPNS